MRKFFYFSTAFTFLVPLFALGLINTVGGGLSLIGGQLRLESLANGEVVTRIEESDDPVLEPARIISLASGVACWATLAFLWVLLRVDLRPRFKFFIALTLVGTALQAQVVLQSVIDREGSALPETLSLADVSRQMQLSSLALALGIAQICSIPASEIDSREPE